MQQFRALNEAGQLVFWEKVQAGWLRLEREPWLEQRSGLKALGGVEAGELNGEETYARVQLTEAEFETRVREGALAAPVAPSKILCVARNYADHAKEMQGELPPEPVIFMKPPSSLLAPGGSVLLPLGAGRVDFEAELGVVIGRRARRVSAEQALDYVFGYTTLCDISAREYQKTDKHWTRAKGADTFCPVGPELLTLASPEELDIRLWQNGELRQAGNTRDMVFSIGQIIEFVSSYMTLEPGDLIATGTPAGVGPMQPGDEIELQLGAHEKLRFRVEAGD